MDMVVKRFEVWLVALDPTVGHELQKTRPCVIISPDEMNLTVGCILAAPLTSTIRRYPFRQDIVFKRKQGQIALDQMRTLDKSRFIKKMGKLPDADAQQLCLPLQELFSYE